MGYTLDPTTGRILFNRAPQTVTDLQVLADRQYEDTSTSVTNYSDLANVPRKRPGMIRVVTSSKTVWVYISSSDGWQLCSPNFVSAYLRVTAQNDLTNQTTYDEIPVSADAAALRKSNFTKFSGSSVLHVTMTGSAKMTAGIEQIAFLGIRIGSTDYDVAARQFAVAPDRQTIAGELWIPGVAANTYTSVAPVFRAETASAFTLYPGDDFISWSLEEIA